MLNSTISWIGGGIALAIIYIIVSNTLWLLFGSRVIQYLPGVNIKGLAGTLKIASMLVLSVIGTIIWIFKYILTTIKLEKTKPLLKNEISIMIQNGGRIMRAITVFKN